MLTHTRVDTVCFFFSSRRRHTRCGRDWSSDVCSSDLVRNLDKVVLLDKGKVVDVGTHEEFLSRTPSYQELVQRQTLERKVTRSEERRVGKECRSRWGTDHYKKKRGRREGGR